MRGAVLNVLPMEKLKPSRMIGQLSHDEWVGRYQQILEFAKAHGSDKNMLYPWPSDLFFFHREMRDKYKDNLQDIPNQHEQKIKISFNDIKKDFPQYIKYVSAMDGFFTAISKSGSSGTWDLHGKNIMQRENGEYVVIDPFE